MSYPELFRRPGSRIYYFRYTDPATGRRRWKSTRAITKSDAWDIVRGFLDQPNARAREVTFAEYGRLYFVWETCPHAKRLRDEGKSIGRRHVEESRHYLRQWILSDTVFPGLQLGQITRGSILDLRDRVRQAVARKATRIQGEGLNTVNKAMKTVKTILTEAYYRGDIPANPAQGIGALKYDVQAREAFSLEEIRRLFAEQPGPWRDELGYLVFRTVAYTGMRCGEVLALRWESVDLERRVLSIDKAWKHRLDSEPGLPKWNKRRSVILAASLCDLLASWRERSVYSAVDDLIFPNPDGRRLGETWWRYRFQKAIASAGMSSPDRWLTPHSFRHTLNTLLIEAGISDLLLQLYLGWSSANQTLTRVQKGYTHISAEATSPIAAKIDELYNQAPQKSLEDAHAAARARLRLAQ